MNANGNKLKHIDIFSGIGGFSLAFESEGFETVGFVECDERKQIVLRHWWPTVRIFDDMRHTEVIREFCESIGGIDVLTGGVPCQPASALGQMRGTADERWLWPDTIRLVRAVRPRFAVFENPPSLLVLEGGGAWNGIVSGLVASGYDLWWDVFPAAAFGAGHLRERVILCASDAQCQTRSIKRRGEGGEGGEGSESFEHDIPFGKVKAGKNTTPNPKGFRPGGTPNGTNTVTTERHSRSEPTIGSDCTISTNTDREGLEGHAGDENESGENGGGMRSRDDQLPRRIYAAESSQLAPEHLPGGMRLTPEFQCWLMGFPPNWLKPLRDALAMPSCPKSSNQSPEPSIE